MIRILVFGDTPGVTQLIRHLPREVVVGIVGAAIRPQYVVELESLAESIDVPFLIQPKWGSTEYESFVETIRALTPDLIVVNSYSMIIRDDALALIRLGGLNIHGALLPRNRGCNPIQWAIINGETETGVSLHQIDSGLDTGPIVDQRAIQILFDDSWMDVRKKLEQSTDELIAANLQSILYEKLTAVPQDHAKAIVGRRRTSEDGFFSWSNRIIDIYNKIRALLPPLPPAFYINKSGDKITMDSFLTVWQLSDLKYNPMVGGGDLQSERVRLRPLLKQDASILYEWITDRNLMIHNVPYFPVSETDHEAWVEKMMSKRSDLVLFVIEELSTRQSIGTCQLLNINWIHRSAELQIRIGNEAYQSKGFGIEAVKLLCEFGFSDLNLHRVYLHVFASNERAIRSYEKCGFQNEGTLIEAAFINGVWADVLVMGLTKPKRNIE